MFPDAVGETDLLGILETSETGRQLLGSFGLETGELMFRRYKLSMCPSSTILPMFRIRVITAGRCEVMLAFASLIPRANLR